MNQFTNYMCIFGWILLKIAHIPIKFSNLKCKSKTKMGFIFSIMRILTNMLYMPTRVGRMGICGKEPTGDAVELWGGRPG